MFESLGQHSVKKALETVICTGENSIENSKLTHRSRNGRHKHVFRRVFVLAGRVVL